MKQHVYTAIEDNTIPLNSIALFIGTSCRSLDYDIIWYTATGIIILSLVLGGLILARSHNKKGRFDKYCLGIYMFLDIAYLLLLATGKL